MSIRDKEPQRRACNPSSLSKIATSEFTSLRSAVSRGYSNVPLGNCLIEQLGFPAQCAAGYDDLLPRQFQHAVLLVDEAQ